MPLGQGQVLSNRYRIVKLIGQGGFGAVYRAWDISLKQPVAVKENLDTSQEAQRQFEREATLMASLRHPNLPRVTDHFLIPGQGQYLVMDFVEGQNLQEALLARGRPFTEQEILPWVEQVCSALAYLHGLASPIIHRDIKPQNIIITPDGQAMLVDFGISKIYDVNLRTTVGAKAVTPGYSPPEQYSGGVTDARTDIYALGATLYYLLTSQELPESVLRIVGNAQLTPPRLINASISAGMEHLILKATEITTQRRFQSVHELQKQLENKRKPFRPMPLLVTLLALALIAIFVFSGGNVLLANRDLEPVPAGTPNETPTSTVGIPTLTPTSQPIINNASPTVVLASVDNETTVTPTPEETPSPSPTSTPTATRTPTPSRTPTARPTVVTPTVTPTRAAVSTGRGLPLDFEDIGVWVRGDEPNGTFIQSSEQARSGRFSGKLSYNFPTTGNDYVVFLQTNEIGGTPNALQVWVYGDGSGHFFNAWIIDAGGQTWQVPFGQIFHTGWRQMTGYIVIGQSWPWTHISGPNNGQVDYPIRFRGFVLDDYSDAYVGQGVIYIDDLSATTVTNPGAVASPAAPTATPRSSGGTTPSSSPTPAITLSPGSVGRILYTSGNTIMTTDPDWSTPVEVGTAATNTCGTTAATFTGQSFALSRGPFCAVGGTISTCRSPNGQHEILANSIDAQTVAITIRPTTGTGDSVFIYQGPLNRSEGIRWSPHSSSFLFVVGNTVYQGFPAGGYNEIIPIAYEPLFSPDGNYILFRRPVGPGINDVFVSNADGSNSRNVTNAVTIDKRCAVWRQ
jgi:serine/threonine protein kinase